jgi:hypothetical protein
MYFSVRLHAEMVEIDRVSVCVGGGSSGTTYFLAESSLLLNTNRWCLSENIPWYVKKIRKNGSNPKKIGWRTTSCAKRERESRLNLVSSSCRGSSNLPQTDRHIPIYIHVCEVSQGQRRKMRSITTKIHGGHRSTASTQPLHRRR